jgi:hypothetical protein
MYLKLTNRFCASVGVNCNELEPKLNFNFSDGVALQLKERHQYDD